MMQPRKPAGKIATTGRRTTTAIVTPQQPSLSSNPLSGEFHTEASIAKKPRNCFILAGDDRKWVTEESAIAKVSALLRNPVTRSVNVIKKDAQGLEKYFVVRFERGKLQWKEIPFLFQTDSPFIELLKKSKLTERSQDIFNAIISSEHFTQVNVLAVRLLELEIQLQNENEINFFLNSNNVAAMIFVFEKMTDLKIRITDDIWQLFLCASLIDQKAELSKQEYMLAVLDWLKSLHEITPNEEAFNNEVLQRLDDSFSGINVDSAIFLLRQLKQLGDQQFGNEIKFIFNHASLTVLRSIVSSLCEMRLFNVENWVFLQTEDKLNLLELSLALENAVAAKVKPSFTQLSEFVKTLNQTLAGSPNFLGGSSRTASHISAKSNGRRTPSPYGDAVTRQAEVASPLLPPGNTESFARTRLARFLGDRIGDRSSDEVAQLVVTGPSDTFTP